MKQQSLSIYTQARRIWGHLTPYRKKQLVGLGILMMLSSFAEMISLGALLPFIGIIVSPDQIYTFAFAQILMHMLKVSTAQDLLLPITLIFSLTVVFAGLVRVALLWFQTQISLSIGADLSVAVYERTLYQPYWSHVSRNSSEVLAAVEKARSLVFSIIQPVIYIISALLISIALCFSLFLINTYIAMTILIGYGAIYTFLVLKSKSHISKNSKISAVQLGSSTKVIQEGLGGIRDVIIGGLQPFFSKLYWASLDSMHKAISSNQIYGAAPRFGIEALTMVLVAWMGYAWSTSIGGGQTGANLVPLLGTLTFGIQRLLPLINQIYNASMSLKGNKHSIEDALEQLDQITPDHSLTTSFVTPITFHHAISLKQVGFRYTSDGPWILRNFDLDIQRGSRIGLVGTSGNGKTTLLDLILGLIIPTEGSIFIDGSQLSVHKIRNWQMNISHVSQATFLSDVSVLENIAFGESRDEIDVQRVRQAAAQVLISEVIEGLPEGYETVVGERGMRLSGGQRQLIGIARALYKKSCVLVLDEATSALDSDTETTVMRGIENIGREITIIIVAHRLKTLRNCDFIVELANGNVKSIGTYQQMFGLETLTTA